MSDNKSPIDAVQEAVKALRETAEKNNKARDIVLEEKMAKIDGVIDSLNEKIDGLALAASRPTAATATKADSDKVAIFTKGLRKGFERLSETEQKAMSAGDGTGLDGGVTLPRVIYDQIIAKVYESNTMRALSGGYTTSGDKLEFFAEASEVGSGWVAETADRTETATAQIGNFVINLHEMYAEPRLTRQIIEDSMFNLEAWLVQKVGEKFARAEATAFVSGDGTGKPKGILAYANAASSQTQVKTCVTATSAKLVGDDIVSMVYDMKSAYLNGATWQMGRGTQSQIRLLKDTQGHYLWEASYTAGKPSTLFGFPIYQNEDLDAFAAGGNVAIFGDLKTAYAVVDHPGSLIVIRDEITQKQFVKLYHRTRVGGGLVQGEAARILQIKS